MNTQLSATSYNTLVFDCDGVVLDSNKIKTEAFYQATLPFGEAAAQAMVEYHIANGGVSRYKKFAYFLEEIAPVYAEHQGPDLDALLLAYAGYVREGLLSCEMAPGLEALRQQTSSARWLVVSGGDQAELRDVFALRGIAQWFDGGIFGSPDSKLDILERESNNGNIQAPAIFFGDSRYDYEVSKPFGFDFIFVSQWTEVRDWEAWVSAENIRNVRGIEELE